MIVTRAAACSVGRGRRHGSSRSVLGVNRVGIEAELVIQCLTSCKESDRKICGFAVPTGQSKADVQSSFPTLQQAWMQRLLISLLLGVVAQSFHVRFRH